MTDPKNNDDIITSADEQPETLIDEQLEDVDGGYRYELKNVMVSSYNLGGAGTSTIYGDNLADTIYGGSAGDVLDTTQLFGGAAILRKRPGR